MDERNIVYNDKSIKVTVLVLILTQFKIKNLVAWSIFKGCLNQKQITLCGLL